MLDGPWGHGAGGRLILYRASFSPRFLSVIPQNSAIKGRLELFVHLILLQSTGPRLWLQSRHLEFRDNSYWTGHWSCTISQIPTHEGNCVCTYWYSLHLLRYRLSRDMRRSVLLATAVRLINFFLSFLFCFPIKKDDFKQLLKNKNILRSSVYLFNLLEHIMEMLVF